MPLIDLPVAVIELPVSDRIQGATLIKQKARYADIDIPQDGERISVKLHLTVSMYAATADGGYGEPLTGDGFSTYPKVLVADNNTAVYFNHADSTDPDNGAIRYIQLQQGL